MKRFKRLSTFLFLCVSFLGTISQVNCRHGAGSGSFDPKDYGWVDSTSTIAKDLDAQGSGVYNAKRDATFEPFRPPRPPPSPSPKPPPRPPPKPPAPPPPSPPPPPVMDVWILAGQSNMVGENGYDDQPWPEPWSIPNNKMMMFPMHSSTQRWQPAQNNVGAISQGCSWCTGFRAGVGPEVAFAHTLLMNNRSQSIGFIPTAIGGTTLAWAWNPNDGLEYNNMINTVHRAMQAEPARPKRLRGIIWVQGESDALEFATSVNYGMNLWNLIHQARAALSRYHPSLPWIITKMAVHGRTKLLPYIESVRAGQEAMAFGIPNIVMVDMEGMDFYLQYYSGGMHPLHLSKRGACELGRAIGEAWIKNA